VVGLKGRIIRPRFFACAVSLSFLSMCRAQVSEIYPPVNTMITGDCEADLKPGVAVISGGVCAGVGALVRFDGDQECGLRDKHSSKVATYTKLLSALHGEEAVADRRGAELFSYQLFRLLSADDTARIVGKCTDSSVGNVVLDDP
jgi:hypothetical protein